jgi:hypothetical protein
VADLEHIQSGSYGAKDEGLFFWKENTRFDDSFGEREREVGELSEGVIGDVGLVFLLLSMMWLVGRGRVVG